jgi:pimeloyl-ACP methyl ester carboxylesterase
MCVLAATSHVFNNILDFYQTHKHTRNHHEYARLSCSYVGTLGEALRAHFVNNFSVTLFEYSYGSLSSLWLMARHASAVHCIIVFFFLPLSLSALARLNMLHYMRARASATGRWRRIFIARFIDLLCVLIFYEPSSRGNA